MQSIREIYKVGMGPSSSHTMGPKKAAEFFKNKNPNARFFKVHLFGSLAATGKGHLSDKALLAALNPIKTEIIWNYDKCLSKHPNGMKFEALDKNEQIIDSRTIYSVGGGDLWDGQTKFAKKQSYKLATMQDILNYCDKQQISFWQFVEENEGKEIWQFLKNIYYKMTKSVERGLKAKGKLPGPLQLERKAAKYYHQANISKTYIKRTNRLFSYALAAAEENAAGGEVVTAPTCGSCGVIPAVLLLMNRIYKPEETKILRALATAGLIGNLAKENASISGAAVGCQGEIGVACAMAAGAVAQIIGGTNMQIEYAAEMGLEHHLGLTCDPIAGLVQIPCIERNAMASSRAIDCAAFALASDGTHIVSYDDVLDTMKTTGQDLSSKYRETALGGLAKQFELVHLESEKNPQC